MIHVRFDLFDSLTHCTGTRAGRVKVIFTLPRKLSEAYGGQPAPSFWPRAPLVYIEWYSRFTPTADPVHLMYVLSKPPPRADGLPPGTIIPLSQIRQSCHLSPVFPSGAHGQVPQAWSSDNVLDIADRFYLNNWAGVYGYQTLW